MANRCTFFGRLVNDVEVRYSTNTQKAIASFSIAVKREMKNKEGKYDSDFFSCIAFDKRAEVIGNFFSKGSKILVWGPMRQEKWQDKDGNTKTTYKLYVEGFEFIDSTPTRAAKPTTPTAFSGMGAEVDF